MRLLLVITACLLCSSAAFAGEFTVVSISPSMNALNGATNDVLSVTFDQPVNPTTITSDSFWAFAKWSGTVTGSFALSNGDQTVTLFPDHPFSAGEQVMVILSHDIESADGAPFRAGGYSWQFWTKTRTAASNFSLFTQFSTNSQGGPGSTPYGGVGTDLNNDGWLDISLVNETTDDLRVFLNSGDGLGNYDSLLLPTTPMGEIPSPSEPSDFNHDGFADMCVANTANASVSILLGNGDGSFVETQQITVGSIPRGITVLDADGDGDIDVACANLGSSNVSVLLNDGSGSFSAPASFNAGVSGERALVAADMDNDGLLDLVVSGNSSQTIAVNRANGDGTFTPQTPQAVGGATWMLLAGDLNGDGNNDVTSANSSNNNGSVLFGNGASALTAPTLYATDPFPLATDLGDVDGDGDLDWITSSFSGDFTLFLNNSNGVFTFNREFFPPIAASCALPVDIDNDRDLDLVGIDELADVVLIWKNNGTIIDGDANGDLVVDVFDMLDVLDAWGPCDFTCMPGQVFPPCPTDLNHDCETDVFDLLSVLDNWSTP